jgi:zinc transporter 1/2/3
MFVLSIHSLIEGLALGVQLTEEGVIAIFVAIISHKWVESLALGSSLMRSNTSTSTIVILAVVYSFVTPTGILLGFLSQQILSGTYSVAFTAIITGISAGTFVYIATIDILTEEFRTTRDRFPKFASTVFGFALTSALFIFLDKD